MRDLFGHLGSSHNYSISGWRESHTSIWREEVCISEPRSCPALVLARSKNSLLHKRNDLPSHISYLSHQTQASLLLIGTTGIQYIMYHEYMTGPHCSFYGFIGPFIVHVFAWELCLVSFSTFPLLPPSLNPLPFAIDVHLSIFACVWAYFGKTSVTRPKRGAVWKKSCFIIGSSCCCWDTSEEMENWKHTHPIYH